MRKRIITLILLLFCITYTISSYASTNTETRTRNDLKIRDDIKQTSTVINSALKTPKVDETEKIYDFADLFTDSEEEILYEKVTEFIDKYNMDMAIVTIANNNKYSAMQYADDFYDYNYFGIGDSYDGLLLLIDMDNRNSYITTTGKAIDVYTDSKLDSILDDMYYNKSPFVDSYESACAFIDGASSYAHNYKVANKVSKVVFICSFSIVIAASITYFQYKKHKTVKKKLTAKEYLKTNSVHLDVNQDRFISTHTTRIRRESSSGGGNSSTHHSSSGHSHGGRGR